MGATAKQHEGTLPKSIDNYSNTKTHIE